MGRYAKAAKEAAELTNKQLAGRLASFGPVNDARFQELLPTKRDKETFIELMRVVEEEADEEARLAFLVDNAKTAGKVALKVLRAFV